jgi:hypothetical protein
MSGQKQSPGGLLPRTGQATAAHIELMGCRTSDELAVHMAGARFPIVLINPL